MTPGTALRWVQGSPRSGAPKGAVIGGCSPDGKALYVVQIITEKHTFASNYNGMDSHVEGFYKEFLSSTVLKYLVYSGRVLGKRFC